MTFQIFEPDLAAAELQDLAPSKVQLMLAAEGMFARRGINGASLREIATSAGHGNNNAVRYHFGSKEGLAQAIFRFRVLQMEEPRRRMLDKLHARGASEDLRSICEVIFLPHIGLVDIRGDHPYAGFLLSYIAYNRPRGMSHFADLYGPHCPSLTEAQDLFYERVRFLPADLANNRLLNATSIFLTTLVVLDNRELDRNSAGYIRVIDDTLEQIVAGACAPHRIDSLLNLNHTFDPSSISKSKSNQ